MIPYGRQDINQADIDAVVEVLTSDFLTQGPAVPAFEHALAGYCGAAHGIAVNSATSALHIACLAIDVGPGDLVWTSPITFVASANAALYCGATIDFVDIDPLTFNMSIDALTAKLDRAEAAGALPKVVIPVHMTGQSCDMRAIAGLAARYNFRVIEDASHAVGARYDGQLIGDCRYSDITVFSFHPVKIITTIEGGMAVTNDVALAERMALFRSHGITRDPRKMQREPDGAWYYEQVALGFNYRMTDVQAALGISQLQRLDQFVARRQGLAARYDELLADVDVIAPWQHPATLSSFHLYIVRLPTAGDKVKHRAIFDGMRTRGVGVNLHYMPVHLQPWYENLGFTPGTFVEAERYYGEALTLPLYPGMSDADQDQVVAALKAEID